MEEINIIKKLESLKEIKPSNEWVISAKKDILSKKFVKEEKPPIFATFISTCSHIFETPKVLAPVLSGMIVVVFGFALISSQSTMPGDSLYSLKKAYNQIATSLLPADKQAVARINQADKLLAQLDSISKSSDNTNRNIEAGMEEVKKAFFFVCNHHHTMALKHLFFVHLLFPLLQTCLQLLLARQQQTFVEVKTLLI
jgi:hypothetical protein